jgi:hypothetical protein
MPLAPYWPHVITITAAAMATATLIKLTITASAAPMTPSALPSTSTPMLSPLAILTLALSPLSAKGLTYLITIATATASILAPLTIADLIQTPPTPIAPTSHPFTLSTLLPHVMTNQSMSMSLSCLLMSVTKFP